MITLPLTHHLHILQLEGYSPPRFLRWWLTHPLDFQAPIKTTLKYTPKAKRLLVLSMFSASLLITLSYIYLSLPTTLLISFLLFFFPYPLLFFALLLIKPYEIINLRRTISITSKILASQSNLTTIGITGSYGKTSTKNFLYHLLDHHHYSLKTPASYNTIFGIAKAISFELTSKVDSFICEYGAYVRGEIKQLTRMVPPDYAILTAIGPQHLERFKTLHNTTLAKFELIDAVIPQNALVNLDNDHIRYHLEKHSSYQGINTYSFKYKKATFYVSQYQLTSTGSSFTIKYKGESYAYSTHLFGTSNLENLVAAISMCLLLKVPHSTITKALTTLKPAPNRLEIKTINQATVIDNTYSSNVEGFTSIINDLKPLKGKKALISPGIVELGDQTVPVHTQIGKQAATVFDTIILVGQSSRTQALEKAIRYTHPSTTITYLTSPSDYWPTVRTLSQTHSWILLENDLPDNY